MELFAAVFVPFLFVAGALVALSLPVPKPPVKDAAALLAEVAKMIMRKM